MEVKSTKARMFIFKLKELWEESNAHHTEVSTHFGKRYKDYRFERFVNKVYKHTTVKTFYIEEEGVIIACGILGYEILGEVVKLMNFVVKEEYRRKGVATKLFSAIEAYIEEGGYHLEVEVSHGNNDALTFYQTKGYYPKSILVEKR